MAYYRVNNHKILPIIAYFRLQKQHQHIFIDISDIHYVSGLGSAPILMWLTGYLLILL